MSQLHCSRVSPGYTVLSSNSVPEHAVLDPDLRQSRPQRRAPVWVHGSQYFHVVSCPSRDMCGWSMHTVGSKGNSACNSGNRSCLRSSSLLTLGLSMVQRRQMEALSRGLSKL